VHTLDNDIRKSLLENKQLIEDLKEICKLDEGKTILIVQHFDML
jgi:hypothetical protein